MAGANSTEAVEDHGNCSSRKCFVNIFSKEQIFCVRSKVGNEEGSKTS